MTISKNFISAAAIGFAAIVVVPSSAFAGSGWYLGAAAGDNLENSETFTNGNYSFQAGYSNNVAWQANAGYSLPNGLRPEFSFTSRSNDADSLSSEGNSTSDVAGHEEADTYMASLWYDIPMQQGAWHRLHPWLGAGVGMAHVSVRGLSTYNLGPYISIDDDKSVFAYQFGVGLGYDVARNWMATADFRYLATDSADYNVSTDVIPIAINGSTVHGGYSSESVMIGLRYQFGQSP